MDEDLAYANAEELIDQCYEAVLEHIGYSFEAENALIDGEPSYGQRAIARGITRLPEMRNQKEKLDSMIASLDIRPTEDIYVETIEEFLDVSLMSWPDLQIHGKTQHEASEEDKGVIRAVKDNYSKIEDINQLYHLSAYNFNMGNIDVKIDV